VAPSALPGTILEAIGLRLNSFTQGPDGLGLSSASPDRFLRAPAGSHRPDCCKVRSLDAMRHRLAERHRTLQQLGAVVSRLQTSGRDGSV
jgi:hypothetical protein